MTGHPFASVSFDKWLGGLERKTNIRLLDLFYWENRVGNWLTTCQAEFDTAWQDIFTPFNCRLLLMNMLSVPEKYRRPPDYLFYRKLIQSLWSEVLQAPINPHKPKQIAKPLKARVRYHLSMMKRLVISMLPNSLRRLISFS